MDTIGLEDIVIISNRSASLIRNRIIDIFASKLEESKRETFIQNNINVYAKNFPSGEVYAQVQDNIRGKNVHLICGYHRDDLYSLRRKIANSNLELNDKVKILEDYLKSAETDQAEAKKIMDAVRRSGAEQLSVYTTYHIDSRQDKKDEPRVPISAKLSFDDIVNSGEPALKRIGVIDIHSKQSQGFCNYPVDVITTKPLFILHMRHRYGNLRNIVLVSPDSGASKDVIDNAKMMGVSYALIDKMRAAHSEAEVVKIVGNVKGKIAVLLDDMIDTGGTIVSASEILYKKGAKEIVAYATHGIFSTKIKKTNGIVFAEDRFKKSGIKVVVTDTIERPPEYYKEHKSWLNVLTVAPYLANLIHCNEIKGSHGKLLGRYKDYALKGDPKEIEKYMLKY